MTMVWLRACEKMPYKMGKQTFKVQMSWEESYRISRGMSEEDYKKDYIDTGETPFRLRYFRGNMPPAFNEFNIRTSSDADAFFNGIISSSSLSGRSTPAMIFISR